MAGDSRMTSVDRYSTGDWFIMIFVSYMLEYTAMTTAKSLGGRMRINNDLSKYMLGYNIYSVAYESVAY